VAVGSCKAGWWDLTASIQRSAVHLETRDSYGTETELPHMAKWAAGASNDQNPWMVLGLVT